MADAVQVQGLRELVFAFRVANREVAKDVRTAIEQAGEPIREEAQRLVQNEISGMARSKVRRWWMIRAGIEKSTIGYIVPEERGRYTKRNPTRYARPKLAPLIAEREQRALDTNVGRVEDEFEDALDEVARAWARV